MCGAYNNCNTQHNIIYVFAKKSVLWAATWQTVSGWVRCGATWWHTCCCQACHCLRLGNARHG
jgi:hypothetical protein